MGDTAMDEKSVGTDLPSLSSLNVVAAAVSAEPTVVLGKSARTSAQETIFGKFNTSGYESSGR